MINVVIYGLDQFVAGDVSTEMISLLSKLYEIDSDEILISAPSTMIFHNGVDQTSWNTVVEVHLPKKLSVLQEKASAIIFALLKDVTINISIQFCYYLQDEYVSELNPDYPRFITESNEVHTDSCDCDHDDDECEENDEEIYTGDIFKDFSK